MLRYAYGKYLYFLRKNRVEVLAQLPAARFTPALVKEFVVWQPASCGPATIAIYLYGLWLALHYLCPEKDWGWLDAIHKRVKFKARAEPRRHPLVTSETLYKLGMKLMDSALSTDESLNPWYAQAAYRDGVIFALLALIPLRRGTLASLRIGKHLVKVGNVWVLDIPAADVKTRQHLDFPVSEELSYRINVYIDRFRSRIPGARAHDYLWTSSRGRPFKGGAIYNAVRRRSRQALGFPIDLHQFRRAAATFWSIQDPANVRGVKDLLGHGSFASTEGSYIMAHSRLAGRALARAVDRLRAVKRLRPWVSAPRTKKS